MEYNSLNGLVDGKYITSYLMVKATMAKSVIIYELFTNQINSQTFDIENIVMVKKNEIFAILLEMFDSVSLNV